MKIPKDLSGVSRFALRRIIRVMERAIRAECLRCQCIKDARSVKDCDGLHLEEGNCPLYEFRPWAKG